MSTQIREPKFITIVDEIINLTPNMTYIKSYDTADATLVNLRVQGILEDGKDFVKMINNYSDIVSLTGIVDVNMNIAPSNLSILVTTDVLNTSSSGITVTISDVVPAGDCFDDSDVSSIEELLRLPTKDVFEFIINKACNGTNGLSAYQIAVSNGFIGTIDEWLESLSRNGSSAYDVAIQNGFIGNELEWLASIVGEDGKDGIIDYDELVTRILSDTTLLDSLVVTIVEYVGSKVVISINKAKVNKVCVRTAGGTVCLTDKNVTLDIIKDNIRTVLNSSKIIVKIKEVE